MAVRFGRPLIETTPKYILDIRDDSLACKEVDWTCLGSTVAKLHGVHFSEGTSGEELCGLCSSLQSMETVKNLIAACLVNPSRESI